MEDQKVETALFGGGCFWCLEAVFERLPGVIDVESGYSGGEIENPTYEEVCAGDTGHAETVRIRFDPDRIGYEELLEYFLMIHDPTTLNRQGADIGSQYRSVVFYGDGAQKDSAHASVRKFQKTLVEPIVTGVEPAGRFWPAEISHQDYYRKNPQASYCRVVIAPKLRAAGF